MRTFEFDIIVSRDLTGEEEADTLFERFQGDVTPAVIQGVPKVMCAVEAPSFLVAVRRVISGLRAAGVGVVRVEIEPDAVAA